MTEAGKKNGDEKGKNIRNCLRCGAQFYANTSKHSQFCSHHCAGQWKVDHKEG